MTRTLALLLAWSLTGCTAPASLWVDTPLAGATLTEPDVHVRALLGGRDRDEVCVRAYLDGTELEPENGKPTKEGYEYDLPDSVSWSLTELEDGAHGLRIEWGYCDRAKRRRTLVAFTVDTTGGTGTEDAGAPGTSGGTGEAGGTGGAGGTGSGGTAKGSGGSGGSGT